MELSISDQINSALLLITAIGVLGALWQIRMGAKTQRATFLKDLYMNFRSDLEVSDAYYLIEYGKFKYTNNFHNSELEPKMDRLLSLADVVCEMRIRGILSSSEMRFFDYPFYRIANDSEVKKYIAFLSNFYKQNNINRKPFSSFQKYATSSK